MSKRAILKVSYKNFLLPEGANLGAILKALSGAIQLDRQFSGGDIYFPEADPDELSIEMVDAKRILKAKPSEVIEPEVIDGLPPAKSVCF